MVAPKNIDWVRLALFVAVVLLLGGIVYFLLSPKQDDRAVQAVFLDNGQVYFGHAVSERGAWLTLENVYYFQARTASSTALADASDISLVKLGNELHGPTNEMKLNRDHILFTEALRADSKVVGAIRAAQ